MLCLKPYLPREYSVVRAIKSFSVLADLSLEKEPPMKCFFLEILTLARSFWPRLYGHLQVINCDINSLGQRTKLSFSGGWYCETKSAWSGEEGPWARGRALLLLWLFSCYKSWASAEGLLATWAKNTFLSAQGGTPSTCMQLPKDKPKEEGTKWKDCSASFTALSEYTSLLWATGVPGALVRTKPPNLRQKATVLVHSLSLSCSLSVKHHPPSEKARSTSKGIVPRVNGQVSGYFFI